MMDYSCFELKKKLQPKIVKPKVEFKGVPRRLHFVAKIISGRNYRYEVFTEVYFGDFEKMKLIDRFVNLCFCGLVDDESVVSVCCDGKPEIFKRFYNPDF